MSIKLSACAKGKDNNLNLIRIAAAFSVLLTHCFVLVTGSPDSEPLRMSLGVTLGSVAVDIFFITSGFLVTGSLLSKKSLIDFALARALRIFPALIAMVTLTIGLGALLSSLPLYAYIQNSETGHYFLKCATLVSGVTYSLPGVFKNNPYQGIVNGSLWTMPFEIKMYGILALTWGLSSLARQKDAWPFKLMTSLSVVASGAFIIYRHFESSSAPPFSTLFFMFFTGSVYCIFKDHVQLSSKVFWLLLMAVAFAANINKDLFFLAYTFSVSYLLLYIAYVPSGFVRKYNDFGDYSYGIYIYAFPVQQAIADLMPGVQVVSMLLMSSAITFLLAFMSWHLIEKRVLLMKDIWVRRTRLVLEASPRNRT